MRKAIGFLLVFAAAAFSQSQATNQVGGPPPNNYVSVFDISSTPQYVCQAQAVQPVTTFPLGGTLTNIVVSSNVGTITFTSTSYLWVGAQITVTGATVATALNATYKVTGVSGSTATITTAGVANATYTDAGMMVATNAPLLNNPVWAIQITQYTSGSPSDQYWAGTPSPVPPMNLKCSSRASY